FKEVLIAAGLLEPADRHVRFGLECAGVVTAVGPQVRRFAVGDTVMAIGSDCFADFALVRESLAPPVPAGLTYAQAASVPVAFSTAYDSLLAVAGLSRGERVLVHA